MARREGWTNAAAGLDGEQEQPEPVSDGSFAHEDALSGGSCMSRKHPTDAQAQQTLRRFVRDKSKPEELEKLRNNLIVARVMSGMTAVEAAERLGYANSTQLSLIESGKQVSCSSPARAVQARFPVGKAITAAHLTAPTSFHRRKVPYRSFSHRANTASSSPG